MISLFNSKEICKLKVSDLFWFAHINKYTDKRGERSNVKHNKWIC
jgi:hypothetical protein